MEVGAASRCSRKRLDKRMEAYERKEVEGVAQDAQEIIEGVGKWNERGMEQESNRLEGMRQENIDRGEVSSYDEITGAPID